MMLKARPTIYKGIRMRSRLEALFAQHCDQAGLAWQYEPDCFADETGQYLPDFMVEEGGEVAYVEVKPTKRDAAQWLFGPMRRIWASRPDAHIVSIHPEKRSRYESTTWFFAHSSAPATTWSSVCSRIDSPSDVSPDHLEIHEGRPQDIIRVDLIPDAEFHSELFLSTVGDRWQGPPLPDVPEDAGVWRLVAGATPTDAWFPDLIEVSGSGIITDTYKGQSFFMNPLWSKICQVSHTRHPYG